jgi:hypothetical protein
MNSGELTRIQLANRLVCASQQISVGPTGPTGGSATIPGALKAFTIFIDYSAGAPSVISRLYIPAGLFGPSNPVLAAGGVFTANQGTDLVFVGGSTITMNNTLYAFVSSISASGYIAAGKWEPVMGGNIGPTHIYYSITNDYSVTLSGLILGSINGGSTTPKPTTGVAAGFLATLTIFYV